MLKKAVIAVCLSIFICFVFVMIIAILAVELRVNGYCTTSIINLEEEALGLAKRHFTEKYISEINKGDIVKLVVNSRKKTAHLEGPNYPGGWEFDLQLLIKKEASGTQSIGKGRSYVEKVAVSVCGEAFFFR